MKFGVEILVALDKVTHVIKRHEAKGVMESLKLAQELAVQMFPEDPMASRTFRSGRYTYENKNDLGDLVIIRPFIEDKSGFCKPSIKAKAAAQHGFVFVHDEPMDRGPEPA